MTALTLRYRRAFRDGGDFDQFLEPGTGGLQSVRLLKAAIPRTAEALLSGVELEALELGFENCVFWVRCDGATDEISLAGKPSWSVESAADLSTQEPWRSALGSEILAWSTVIKGANYRDRLQFLFGTDDYRLTLQLEFAASMLIVYNVVPVDAH